MLVKQLQSAYDFLHRTQELHIMDHKPEKPKAPEPEWITTKAAAEIMGVAASNVRYLCIHEKIECRKFGHIWQVEKSAAEAYKRSKRNPDWLYPDDKDM